MITYDGKMRIERHQHTWRIVIGEAFVQVTSVVIDGVPVNLNTSGHMLVEGELRVNASGLAMIIPRASVAIVPLADGAGLEFDLGGGRKHVVTDIALQGLGWQQSFAEKVKITDIGIARVMLHPSHYYIVTLTDGATINVPRDMIRDAERMKGRGY